MGRKKPNKTIAKVRKVCSIEKMTPTFQPGEWFPKIEWGQDKKREVSMTFALYLNEHFQNFPNPNLHCFCKSLQ